MSHKWVLELGYIFLFLAVILVVLPIVYGLHCNVNVATKFEQFHDEELDMQAKLPNIHVISYASGRFKHFIPQKTKHLKQLFGDIPFTLKIYGFRDLDSTFVQTHQDTFNCTEGGGLWLWKPWIVNYHLSHVAKEGDIVIYTDIGRDISNLNIVKLLQQVNQSKSGMLGFSETEREKTLAVQCKGSHIRESGIPLDYVNDKQNVIACLFMLKTQNNVKHVIAEWLRICSIPGMLTYDQHIERPNPKTFQPFQFRHDQSVLAPMLWWHKSVIVGGQIFPYENENMLSTYRVKRAYTYAKNAWTNSFNKLFYVNSNHSTTHDTSSDGKTATNESKSSPI